MASACLKEKHSCIVTKLRSITMVMEFLFQMSSVKTAFLRIKPLIVPELEPSIKMVELNVLFIKLHVFFKLCSSTLHCIGQMLMIKLYGQWSWIMQFGSGITYQVQSASHLKRTFLDRRLHLIITYNEFTTGDPLLPTRATSARWK